MRVDLLDPIRVSSDSGAIDGPAFGGRRARLVLVGLALARGPVPAGQLAGMVWPDHPPPSWQAALRGVIRSLRNALEPIGLGGDSLVVTTAAGYALRPGAEIDVWLAHDALREGARLLVAERHAAAIASVERVTEMSGARLLPGEDLDWLETHRRALDELRLRALAIVGEGASAMGDHERAIEASTLAVRLAPLDEALHRSLIKALSRAGNRAGAVRAYEHCRLVLAEELGVDPSQETVQTYLSVLADRGAGGAARMPQIATTFVGRESETARLAELLAEPGLVVVTGRGGVGKTRLAVQAAQACGEFDGARLWVPLGALANNELVASSVALAVGAQAGEGDPAEALVAQLAPRGRVLLVLDGCDAVADGVAAVGSVLLAACSLLTILATSRAPIHLMGARQLTVEPLPAPSTQDLAGFLASPQVRLLADRTSQHGDALRLDGETIPLVAAVCRRCAGLPLAVELAAAQLAVISLRDLADDLAAPVDTNLDELRALVRYSHGLLNAEEAAVFRRLAVFDGPIGLPLIRGVAGTGGVAPARVARILHELAARSLLTIDRAGPRWKYHQDDDLRRFASDQLVLAGERSGTLTLLAGAIRGVLPADPRTEPASFASEVTAILPTVRAFLGAALAGHADLDDGLEIAFRLHRYWAATDVSEGRFWLSRLLAMEPGPQWRGQARFALGYLSYWSGDAVLGSVELSQALADLRGHDDSYAARALVYLGGLADDCDRGSEAVEHLREAITLTGRLGEHDLRTGAVIGMGAVLAERADPHAARFADRAITLCRKRGSPAQLAATLPTAAMICWQVGAVDQAAAYVTEAWPLHIGARRIARVVLLAAAAGIAFGAGNWAEAIDLARTADEEGTLSGVRRELPLIRCLLSRALLEVGEVADAAAQAAAAVTAAQTLSYRHPMADVLETVALVGLAAQAPNPEELSRLLATASRIRQSGQRPGAPSLRGRVEEARRRLPVADALPIPEAAALATRIARRHMGGGPPARRAPIDPATAAG